MRDDTVLKCRSAVTAANLLEQVKKSGLTSSPLFIVSDGREEIKRRGEACYSHKNP
jgi:hypothetical protein